jgi:hypothetical protein
MIVPVTNFRVPLRSSRDLVEIRTSRDFCHCSLSFVATMSHLSHRIGPVCEIYLFLDSFCSDEAQNRSHSCVYYTG